LVFGVVKRARFCIGVGVVFGYQGGVYLLLLVGVMFVSYFGVLFVVCGVVGFCFLGVWGCERVFFVKNMLGFVCGCCFGVWGVVVFCGVGVCFWSLYLFFIYDILFSTFVLCSVFFTVV
jgi:hypothetical protein